MQAIVVVDAGGTKTRTALISSNKEVLHIENFGSGSVEVVGFTAFDTIEKSIQAMYDFAGSDYEITKIVLGISGLGVLQDKNVYIERYKKRFNAEIYMDNDAILAGYTILQNKYNEAILVLSGTGSAVLAMKDGKSLLVGGYGKYLTECGSAYMVVVDLIKSIIHNYETSKTTTELGQSFMDLLGYENRYKFKCFMFEKSKMEVADYAKFIVDMAVNKNNKEAIELLKKAGKDLAIDTIHAFNTLGLSQNAVLGFRGSFVCEVSYVHDELIKVLKENNINLRIVQGVNDPIYGALYWPGVF